MMDVCKCCEKISLVPYAITELNDQGSYSSFRVCIDCIKHYTDFFDDEIKFDGMNVVHIETSEQLFEFITENKKDLLTCKCGITEVDLDNGSRLGCAECYETFEHKLVSILENYHGSSKHKGKMPASMQADLDFKLLKLKYAKALELEQYEMCQKLKEQIDKFSI